MYNSPRKLKLFAGDTLMNHILVGINDIQASALVLTEDVIRSGCQISENNIQNLPRENRERDKGNGHLATNDVYHNIVRLSGL